MTATASLHDLPAPATSRARVLGLDVARSLAILGMLLAHFGSVALAEDPTGWPNSVVRFTDGRAMPLFVLLSGAGVTFLLRRSTRPVRELLGRAALLLLLGLLLEFTTPVAVILQSYALFFVLALGLRFLADRWLLVLAAATAAAGAAARMFLADDLPKAYEHVGGLSEHIGALRLVLRPDVLASDLFVTGFYSALPTLAFLLVGMWLGRQDLASRRLRTGLIAGGLAMAVVGYGAGWLTDDRRAPADELVDTYGEELVVAIEEAAVQGATLTQFLEYAAVAEQTTVAEVLGVPDSMEPEVMAQLVEIEQDPLVRELTEPDAWWLLNAAGHSHMPAWLFGTLGFSLFVTGLCLVAADRFPRATLPLARAGQLALTLYVAHLVLLRWPMQDWPWGFTSAEAVLLIVSGFLVAVALSHLWRLRFRQGPLETVLRLAGGHHRA
jgi:uncharacterized membrane protein YeiB